MFKIHEVRTKQNFKAFDTVCKKENVDFFSMIDLVRLLKGTLDYGERLEDKRISYKRVNDQETLCRLVNNATYIIEVGDEAFSVKPETLKMFEEIYEIQREEDRNAMKYRIEYGGINFVS